jgi:branched-subunit amino acid aminotransferase/4-amino-4-deoxychorismate lyase
VSGQLLRWGPGGGLRPSTRDTGALLAADSWLVTSGAARGLSRHQDRFTAACSPLVGAAELGAFWSAVRAVLPTRGHWFPRVELVADGGPRLQVRVRVAPPIRDRVVVWVHDGPDPRRHPRRKGPDLKRLAGVRARAEAAGAGEALLTTGDGVVVEGATSSVLWWESGVLCAPSPRLRVLDGVTSGLIQAMAAGAGVRVRHRQAKLADLAGREVWVVNALHGIRPVTAWIGADLPAGPAIRAPQWRDWLAAQSAPVNPAEVR